MEQSRTVWTAFARDRWARLAAGILVVMAVPHALPVLPPSFAPLYFEEYSDHLLLCAVLVAVVGGIRRVERRADRRFWGWIAVAFALWWLVLLSYLLFPAAVGTPLGDLSGDGLYTLFYISLVLALQQRPHEHALPAPWRRLETVGTVSFVVALWAYFILVPSLLSYVQYDTWLPSLYMYVALDAYVLVRLVISARRSPPGRYRQCYALLALAFTGWLAADVLETLTWAGRLEVPSGSWVDLLWTPPYALVIVAARLRHVPERRPSTIRFADTLPAPMRAAAPVVVLAFVLPTFHLLIYGTGILDPTTRAVRDVVVLGALTWFGLLVLGQQYLLAGANRRLTSDLSLANEQLEHAAKLEAVGRLAGGVAHDFNNVLTAITGHASLLMRRLPDGEETHREAHAIARAADRAAGLTRQLLAFSRKQVLQPRVIDLNQVVSEMDRMLRRVIGAPIRLVSAFGGRIGHVRADPGQIEQVVLNLAVNARDAMPGGGTLTIRTEQRDVDASVGELEPGRYVTLSVRDTGCGMDEDTIDRIFEPFFTTKARGAGTGLGLATAYGIVKQSGGEVLVESEPGVGTTFTLLFPRVDAPVTAAAPVEPAGLANAPGNVTVLLVEDEPAVRDLVRDILELAGFVQILEAEDGVEALTIARAYSGPIELVVTDVVMPRMGGPELVEALRAERPETRVLYMSGYNEERIFTQEGLETHGMAYLQKPFGPDDLTARVRHVLGN